MATVPVSDPGCRTEPPVSLPSEPDTMWAATATALPPEEPPGTRLGSQGFLATQNALSPQTVGLATALTAFSRLLGGAVGVAVLTSVLIALLRQAAPEAQVAAGGDVLMDLFHAALASSGADAQALQRAGESAFRHLFFFAAAVSVISPLLVMRLEEKALRGKVSLAEAVE